MDTEALKTEIISSLKADITSVKEQLKRTIAEYFDGIQRELQATQAEIDTNAQSTRSDI